MNKQMYDIIMTYDKEINNVFERMQGKGFSYDEVAEHIGELDFVGIKYLGIDYENLQKIESRMDEVEPTYITESYSDGFHTAPKYQKLYIIRDYEDDMVFCIDTAEQTYLVPKNLLDNPNIERLDNKN